MSPVKLDKLGFFNVFRHKVNSRYFKFVLTKCVTNFVCYLEFKKRLIACHFNYFEKLCDISQTQSSFTFKMKAY